MYHGVLIALSHLCFISFRSSGFMSNYEPDEVYLKLSLSLLSFFSSSVAVLTDPEAIGCWFIPCELHSFLQIVENVRADSHLACLRDWSCRIWPSLPTTPVRRLYLLSFTHAPEFHPHQHPPLFPFFFFLLVACSVSSSVASSPLALRERAGCAKNTR